MAITVKYDQKPFTPAPEGLHQAVCCDVIDLGMMDTPWGRKEKVRLRWQLDEASPDTGKRFDVSGIYTKSLSPKANLRQMLETWRAKRFSEPELQGFDLEKLLGVNCQVQVIHKAGEEGQVYANVLAVVPPAKGSLKLTVVDYIREQDRAGASHAPAAEVDDDIPF
jgi:hypothetical protein